MKLKHFLIFSILILIQQLCLNHLRAQSWAPAGAQWHYSFDIFSTTGYVHIEYAGDTVLVCDLTEKTYQDCKILNKTRHTYDYVSEAYHTANLGQEYTWANADTVLLYKHDRFYVLYDFSAEVGDTWEIPEIYETYCDSIGVVKVVSVGDTLVNSELLRYIVLEPEAASQWVIRGMVVEKIGPLNWYMFPEHDGCIADLYEGGVFRCYEDDDFEFQIGIVPYCNFIVTTPEINEETKFNIFPNPASNTLVIENSSQNIVQISITDLYGKTIVKLKNVAETVRIDISKYPAGSYLVHFTDNKSLFKTKKIQKK